MQRSFHEAAVVSWARDSGPIELVTAEGNTRGVPAHVHTTYALGVVTEGVGRTTLRDRSHLLPAGTVITIAPGDVHTGDAASSSGWSHRMFYLPPALLEGAAEGSLPRLDTGTLTDPALAELIVRTHRAFAQGSDPLRAESLLLLALARLRERHLRDAARPARDTAIPDGLHRAKAYIDRRHGMQITLRDLATVAGLSVFQLARGFARAFGIPPYVYAEALRVEYARLLLRQGEPISAVAYRTGFSDQSHLTRHFKRMVGITPGQYAGRRRQRSG